MEFVINVPHVGFHRFVTDVHPPGDFLEGPPRGDLIHDLPFTDGELREVVITLGQLVKVLDDFARYRRGHGRTALKHFADGSQNFRWLGGFKQITVRPRCEGLENPLHVFVNRENQWQQVRVAHFEFPNAFNARPTRQAQIHQHYLRSADGELFGSVFRRSVRAHTPQAGSAINQNPQALARFVFVLNDGDVDQHAGFMTETFP